MSKKYPRVSLDAVQKFVSKKNLAIVGISRDPKKFGNAVLKELKDKGYNIYPVHPEIEEAESIKCYKSIGELPDTVESLFISTKPEKTPDLVKAAHDKNISHIWLQQGAQHDDALQYAIDNKINIIYKQCILMFTEPVTSVHKFHRGFNKIFGIYPKKCRH